RAAASWLAAAALARLLACVPVRYLTVTTASDPMTRAGITIRAAIPAPSQLADSGSARGAVPGAGPVPASGAAPGGHGRRGLGGGPGPFGDLVLGDGPGVGGARPLALRADGAGPAARARAGRPGAAEAVPAPDRGAGYLAAGGTFLF